MYIASRAVEIVDCFCTCLTWLGYNYDQIARRNNIHSTLKSFVRVVRSFNGPKRPLPLITIPSPLLTFPRRVATQESAQTGEKQNLRGVSIQIYKYLNDS